MKNTTKTIIISTSSFGNPITDYYNSLADEFIKHNYKVIFIFDGLTRNNKQDTENKFFLSWTNIRPTKFSDFCFLYKLIKKERPVLCISNFGSTNVVSVVSYLLRVKNRINYVHTTSTQLSIDSNKGNLKALILKYRKQIIYRLNTLLFTNSNGTKNDTVTFYSMPKEKVKIFPYLIKNSTVPYRKMTEREYSICIVGRLNPSKGHKELLYLFKKSLVKFPDLKLKIIGEGYLKTELIELVAKLKILQNVDFIGNIPNSEINDIFSKSLVNISSSIDEAFGLVNIEALREGTPLICTKTAGSLDILLPKVNGIYIDHNEEGSLLNALTIILNNWEYYSNNAIKIFTENYSIENIERQFKKNAEYCLLDNNS